MNQKGVPSSLGTGRPIRFVLAWQTYRVGDVIDPPGTLRGWLIGNGYCEDAEIEQPGRPARMSRTAAAKVAEASRSLFGAK